MNQPPTWSPIGAPCVALLPPILSPGCSQNDHLEVQIVRCNFLLETVTVRVTWIKSPTARTARLLPHGCPSGSGPCSAPSPPLAPPLPLHFPLQPSLTLSGAPVLCSHTACPVRMLFPLPGRLFLFNIFHPHSLHLPNPSLRLILAIASSENLSQDS